jgi:hypothetical protein
MKKTLVTLITLTALAVGLQAQAQKNWKDRAEYDLYEAITKDTNATTRLQSLEKWKTSYPQSEFADVRQKIYLVTYQQQNNHRAAFDTAAGILKTDPNDQAAIQEILGFVRALMPQQPNATLSAQNKADLETAEKTARYLLANADAVYGADKKPQGVTDDAWAKTKPTMTNFAQFTLGYIATTEKDNAKAETELTKALQMDPTNAQASYMLAGVLLGQQKDHPEKTPLALFEYARAGSYDGPNALPAATRTQIDGFLAKAYNTYHGSPEGLPNVKMVAKNNALPPADFKIKSVVEIAKEKAAEEEKFAEQNPMLALWLNIRKELTGDNGDAYFQSSVKDAGLPGGVNGVMKFKGTLISAEPETKPKQLVLAVATPTVADVTLNLDEALPGKMDPGGEIEFSGTAKEFTKEPFMLTFEVSTDDIEGWTGKGPAPVRRGAKKGAAKKQ